MGILNVTPDSFSDGGQLRDPEVLVSRARAMVADGADVLDIGGESTRPGAQPISEREELDRVLPAISLIRAALPDVVLSIDTYKPSVADAAIGAGADVINDVWGGLASVDILARNALRERVRRGETLPETAAAPMARVAARRGCPLILMHNRPDRTYQDFWADVLLDLRLSVAVATAAGLSNRQIWLDPGFGFAKDVAQNLEVVHHLHRIVALGFPVLLGTSRKSTLGRVLGTEVDDRLEAGGASVVWGIQQGCQMVRVHDVREMARLVRMADAIKAGLNFRSDAPRR